MSENTKIITTDEMRLTELAGEPDGRDFFVGSFLRDLGNDKCTPVDWGLKDSCYYSYYSDIYYSDLFRRYSKGCDGLTDYFFRDYFFGYDFF